jgi:hypothetical protein
MHCTPRLVTCACCRRLRASARAAFAEQPPKMSREQFAFLVLTLCRFPRPCCRAPPRCHARARARARARALLAAPA